MKILAIIDAAPGASTEIIRAEIRSEIMGSWKLFSSGVLREAYATATPSRVVFIREAVDIASARAHLCELPLVTAGLFSLELMELRPFVNWSMLFPAPAGEGGGASVLPVGPRRRNECWSLSLRTTT